MTNVNTLVSSLLVGVLACAAEAPVPDDTDGRSARSTILRGDTLVSGVIGSAGGTLELPGLATASVPEGALASSEQVVLVSTASVRIRADFEMTMPFEPAASDARAVVLLAGTQRPAAAIEVTLRIPDNVHRAVSESGDPAVWAQVWQDGGLEILDGFVRLNASLDASQETLTVLLGPESFTRERRSDGLYEAILVVATAPAA